jgi:hypothetical protein
MPRILFVVLAVAGALLSARDVKAAEAAPGEIVQG